MLEVFDDSNFTLNSLDVEGKELGGYEPTGVRRVLAAALLLSEIRNGELKQLDAVWVDVPQFYLHSRAEGEKTPG